MEEQYIKDFDTYQNGHNQNTGGHFGSSNGGTQFVKKDLFNILSALEFESRPGQVLVDLYQVSLTTISRIKQGQSKRKLTEEQVHLVLCNFDNRIITQKEMARKVGVKSTYTLDCIRQRKSYENFSTSYSQLTKNKKNN